MCSSDLGWDSEKTAKIGGDAVNGSYFTNHYSEHEDRPAVKRFVEAYEKKYKKTPDAMAILGYDAMHLMCDSIEKAGSTKGKDIRNALASTKDYPGASGTLTMDADRNAKKPIVVLKIVDGKFTFVKSVNP